MILITKPVVALHNYLMKKCTSNEEDNNSYCPTSYSYRDTRSGVTPGYWRKEESIDGLQPISPQGSSNYSREAKEVWDDFKNYSCSENGFLDWQLERVNGVAYKHLH